MGGEAPIATALRALREKFSVELDEGSLRLVGESCYLGVLPWCSEHVLISGSVFELVLDTLPAEMRVDDDDIDTISEFTSDEVMTLPNNKLVPIATFFFQEYWVRAFGMGIMG